MATITAFTPFDMNTYAIVYGDTAFPFSNSFQVQNSSQIQGYFGANFTYDSFGNTGGVLNGTDYYLATPGFGLVLQYSITGLNHDMATVNNFQGANDPQGMLGYLLIGNDTFLGSSGNDFAKGYGGSDSLEGAAGNDTLDGGPGADVLSGGTGSDTYVVDDLGDVVSETAAEPFPDGDTIIASLTYTLPSTMENLTLAGAAAINGTGNGFPNAITGNDTNNRLNGAAENDTLSGGAGNDTLIGGSGNDALSGGAGNDVYVLSSAADIVSEAVGAGTDQIRTGITLGSALPANVENLQLTGSAAIDGSGNVLANIIHGNADNNVLRGAAGNDILVGRNGDDTIYGGKGIDWAQYGTAETGVTVRLYISEAQNTGGAGVDTLVSVENVRGSSFADTLTGNSSAANHFKGAAGNDILRGRGGNDTLTGNAGRDEFVFNFTLDADTNVDVVTDFKADADRLLLDEDIFTTLATGMLNADAFYRAPGATSGNDAEDRIVYDRSTGHLYYDADGSGSAAATLFAVLAGTPPITAAGFVIIE